MLQLPLSLLVLVLALTSAQLEAPRWGASALPHCCC